MGSLLSVEVENFQLNFRHGFKIVNSSINQDLYKKIPAKLVRLSFTSPL